MRTRRLIIIVIFAAAAVAVLAFPDGGSLFRQEGCSGCHRFEGSGGSIGPDLTGVSGRRTVFWITEQIRDPRTHNENSRMPPHPHLSFPERLAIAVYISR